MNKLANEWTFTIKRLTIYDSKWTFSEMDEVSVESDVQTWTKNLFPQSGNQLHLKSNVLLMKTC